MTPGLDLDTLRRIYPRVLARTLALTRSVPDAEDAVHDALARALASWPESGLPDSPEAWLVTVAGNVHRDRLRRRVREEPRGDPLDAIAQGSPWRSATVDEIRFALGWTDDLLRLLFACCHPALEAGEAAAMALSTVIGLSTREVAAAFVVAPRSMEQRLTRARQRLRDRGDCEDVSPEEAYDRLDAVLRALHLLFNEGYWSTKDDAPVRGELCVLALGLARSLRVSFPGSPEVAGLLVLMMLHEARRQARLDERGEPVPMPRQDRARWDGDAIVAATALLERALAEGKPGPFQIEAAISAVHCRARRAEETDWQEIASLYALLESHRPTPAVRVNRAFAVARADGPAAGLALLERHDTIKANDYPYVHLVRGTLLRELGRLDEARRSLALARRYARNAHERAQIEASIRELGVIDARV